MAEEEDTDEIGFIMWEGWKENECRSRLFGVGKGKMVKLSL
jgi:hypothetical protein